MALASCTKVNTDRPSSEIMFSAVSHSAATRVTDYLDGYANVPFGSYAWYKGETVEENQQFMDNQAIGYDDQKKVWTAIGTTYYWPKFGSIDFICYSPFVAGGSAAAPAPVIGESSISYNTPWNVAAHPAVDVMYADKVVGMSGNVDTDYYGYNSVPVLFHHALSRIAFQVRAGFTEKVAETGDITRWEIYVGKITVDSCLTTGTVDFTLDQDGKWQKPASNVWTPLEPITDYTLNTSVMTVLTEEEQPAGGSFFVLPQQLDNQSVSVYVTIKTFRDNNDGLGERLVFEEHGVHRKAYLKADLLGSWGINQYITYIIIVNPAEQLEPIIFAPSTVDWEYITVPTEIIL